MVKNFLYSNLLIIAGTGTKAGKTTMACRIIDQLKNSSPVAIKISPHFHTSSDGLVIVEEGPGFAIYEETNPGTSKNTSRMLRAGAAKVFLVLVWDSDLEKVFKKVIVRIPGNTPVVCESPSLRKYIEPGLFIIMSSESPNKRQDINDLVRLPHLMFKLEEMEGLERIPVDFSDGKWIEV